MPDDEPLTCVIYNPAAGRGRARKQIDEARRTIGRAFEGAGADELPIVVLVHGEGYVAVGVHVERGSFMAVS